MKKSLYLFLTLLWVSSCQTAEFKPFEDGLEEYSILQKVLENKETYQVQILYTQIDRNEHGNARMQNFGFNLNDSIYFYPASTVKLPVATLALEWLEEQNIAGLDIHTPMLTDAIRPSQIPAPVDSTSENSLPSIAHYIKKILLVSDNDAYNRLYELLGQDYINQKLQEKGLQNTVINHRLSMPMSEEENRYFNPIQFVDKSGRILLQIPERKADKIYSNPSSPKIGKAFYKGDSLIREGLDFTFKNKFSLSDLDGVLKRLIFPMSFPDSERFNLSEEHRQFILQYMSMLPGESKFPSYPQPEYYDSYSKFYKFGTDKNPIPSNFRIFNKTGQAYGHLLDASYFVDFDTGVEFFVTSMVYVNKDQILNDDQYEYEEIGFPFFSELGAYLFEIERTREKTLKPDLNDFKIAY